MKKTTKQAACTCRTETVTPLTLWDALAEAILTFAKGDAVCSIGDALCPLSDLAEWMATLPTTQCVARRYVTRLGEITELATGCIVSHFVTVEMIPAHVRVRQDGTARLKSSQITFLFALESLDFLQNAPGWDGMGWVRPVALDEYGVEFEDCRPGAAS